MGQATCNTTFKMHCTRAIFKLKHNVIHLLHVNRTNSHNALNPSKSISITCTCTTNKPTEQKKHVNRAASLLGFSHFLVSLQLCCSVYAMAVVGLPTKNRHSSMRSDALHSSQMTRLSRRCCETQPPNAQYSGYAITYWYQRFKRETINELWLHSVSCLSAVVRNGTVYHFSSCSTYSFISSSHCIQNSLSVIYMYGKIILCVGCFFLSERKHREISIN